MHLVFQAQKGSCSQGCWSETCLLLSLWQSRKKMEHTLIKAAGISLGCWDSARGAASQGGKHLDFIYSETWAICWGHLETASFDGCRIPPKAPGKGDEILVTDWCWGHLTKDDPTSTQFTPAPQERLRNCHPSGDDHFYGFQKAVAPDEACSRHLTGTAGELSGMALSVLSQHSTAHPWHQLECPIQHQTWIIPAPCIKRCVVSMDEAHDAKPSMPSEAALPFQHPLRSLSRKRRSTGAPSRCKAKMQRRGHPCSNSWLTALQHSSWGTFFFHPHKTGSQDPDMDRSDRKGKGMSLSKPQQTPVLQLKNPKWTAAKNTTKKPLKPRHSWRQAVFLGVKMLHI